jgi:Zn-dependent protease with chaperone function
MARQVPLPVNPSMNGLFIAEPFNGLRTAMNLFQTHPPLEKRLVNLIGRESTGRVGFNTRDGGRGRVAFQ